MSEPIGSSVAEVILHDAGYTDLGEVKCPKCQQSVKGWENPSNGTKVYTNLPDHPTSPGTLHHYNCGEELVDHSLPPVREAQPK